MPATRSRSVRLAVAQHGEGGKGRIRIERPVATAVLVGLRPEGTRPVESALLAGAAIVAGLALFGILGAVVGAPSPVLALGAGTARFGTIAAAAGPAAVAMAVMQAATALFLAGLGGLALRMALEGRK